MASIHCRGVLFDLDGVLVDSTPAVERVWAGWAREHGFVPDEVVKMAHGRPSLTSIRELLPDADHDAENREVERREIADLEGVIPLPGAMELLQSLPIERWAIVTSCTRPLAHVRINAAGLPQPRHLVTSDDIKNGKPDPEPYLRGAQLLGTSDADLRQAGADWIVNDCSELFLDSSATGEDFLHFARRTKQSRLS